MTIQVKAIEQYFSLVLFILKFHVPKLLKKIQINSSWEVKD